MQYIYRAITPAVERGAEYFPVIVVTGPRQSGKSTLCNHIFNDYAKYNLEEDRRNIRIKRPYGRMRAPREALDTICTNTLCVNYKKRK